MVNEIDSANALQLITWNNMPVVLTETLAALYETQPKQIRQNHSNNKERFVEQPRGQFSHCCNERQKESLAYPDECYNAKTDNPLASLPRTQLINWALTRQRGG